MVGLAKAPPIIKSLLLNIYTEKLLTQRYDSLIANNRTYTAGFLHGSFMQQNKPESLTYAVKRLGDCVLAPVHMISTFQGVELQSRVTRPLFSVFLWGSGFRHHKEKRKKAVWPRETSGAF